jgi:hypothetical protein
LIVLKLSLLSAAATPSTVDLPWHYQSLLAEERHANSHGISKVPAWVSSSLSTVPLDVGRHDGDVGRCLDDVGQYGQTKRLRRCSKYMQIAAGSGQGGANWLIHSSAHSRLTTHSYLARMPFSRAEQY